jgi:hypothetical protein
MRPYSLLILGLLSFSLTDCKHDADLSPCYGGTVLGETCLDGVLVQVDERYPIGKPVVYRTTSGDSLAGSNVVAIVNSLGALNVKGQHVYFYYAGGTDQPGPSRICTANTVRLAIPHVATTNVSTSACAN